MNPSPLPPPEGDQGRRAYEITDAEIPLIAKVACIIALGVVASLGIAAWLYHTRYVDLAAPTPRQSSFSGGPETRSSIANDWVTLDRETQTRLQEYSWIDRSRGVVRIPIDRAMELVLTETASSPRASAVTPSKP